MDFIQLLERNKMKLASQLQKELVHMGCGPNNSERIDRLNERISEVEATIDAVYKLHELPREEVQITPYTYLDGFSHIRDLVPFVKKLDKPHVDLCDVRDNVGKLIAIRKEFK